MAIKDFNLPIFNKIYDFYKETYKLRSTLPKQDRYAIWQRVENTALNILEDVFTATAIEKAQKVKVLENTSLKLNFLRVLVRLSKDTKAINTKRYLFLQERLDEIGRMLGGWIKATKIP